MASNHNHVGAIRKLQKAINSKGECIVYNTSQFYSFQQDRPVTKHTIRKAVLENSDTKPVYVDLFSTFSQVQVVLFLRDYWYMINDIPLPEDNEMWNEIRKGVPMLNGSEEEN